MKKTQIINWVSSIGLECFKEGYRRGKEGKSFNEKKVLYEIKRDLKKSCHEQGVMI